MSIPHIGNDIAKVIKPYLGIPPQTITDTYTGTETDIVGYAAHVVCVQIDTGVLTGVDTDNRFEISIEQSKESGAGYVAADADQYGPVILPGDSVDWDFKIDNNTTDASKPFWFNFWPKIGYRYLKIKITKIGSPTSMVCDAFIWYLPQELPAVDV